MKQAVIAFSLTLCLLLTGCGMGFEGDYLWQQSHPMPDSTESGQNISVSDYASLYDALRHAVEAGLPQVTISVALYDRDTVASDTAHAITQIRRFNPIAAYALQDIEWKLGSIGGEQVLVAQMSYSCDQAHIRRIKAVENNEQAMEAIASALCGFESGIVLRIRSYREADFLQLVADYAAENPHLVMEVPEVSASIYPEIGNDRLIELKFSYLTSRDILRTMQQQVATVVDAAVDMVSLTQDTRGKYTQMYALLVERLDYSLETSLTPAYSLLLYGVGDSKAFATVYAAMCHQAGLECLTVVGTYNSEPRYWNIVQIDGVYYHVDLLRSKEEGQFRDMTDEEMEGYVWYFPAYPTCGPRPEAPLPPEPEDTVPQA